MNRRLARETAMQVLFMIDVGANEPNQAFVSVVESKNLEAPVRDFAKRLVFGTLDNLEHIDKVISEISKGWRLERIAHVDKALIRLALYEILYEENIPAPASVNEALELAKVFGGQDSSKFVNGILGKVVENIGDYMP